MLPLYLSMLESEEDKITFEELYQKYKRLCYYVALYVFSTRHIARMEKLFRKERQIVFMQTFSSVTKRIAIIIVIASSVFFSFLLTSSQIRAAIRQTVIEWYEQFTRFSHIDMAKNDFQTVKKNEIDYFVFQSTSDGHMSKVIWQENGYSFLLQSTLGADELLAIAASAAQK